MKTVFEGVVNNVSYDNVKEYNDALMAALNAGGPVDAYTSTKSVTEAPVEPEVEESEAEETPREKLIREAGPDMFRGFYKRAMDGAELVDEDVLVEDLTDMMKMDGDDIAELVDDRLTEALRAMNENELLAYTMDVVDIRKFLESASANYERKTAALNHQMEIYTKKLAELKAQAEVADKASDVCDTLSAYYLAVSHAVTEAAQAREEKKAAAKRAETPKKLTDHQEKLQKLIDLCNDIFPEFKL